MEIQLDNFTNVTFLKNQMINEIELLKEFTGENTGESLPSQPPNQQPNQTPVNPLINFIDSAINYAMNGNVFINGISYSKATKENNLKYEKYDLKLFESVKNLYQKYSDKMLF